LKQKSISEFFLFYYTHYVSLFPHYLMFWQNLRVKQATVSANLERKIGRKEKLAAGFMAASHQDQLYLVWDRQLLQRTGKTFTSYFQPVTTFLLV
jgi:hypothetical protein